MEGAMAKRPTKDYDILSKLKEDMGEQIRYILEARMRQKLDSKN